MKNLSRICENTRFFPAGVPYITHFMVPRPYPSSPVDPQQEIGRTLKDEIVQRYVLNV